MDNDWIDPFIRELIGTTPTEDLKILMKLLDEKATSPKTAIPKPKTTLEEKYEALFEYYYNKLLHCDFIRETKAHKSYLTKFGLVTALGAKKLFPKWQD